MVPARSARAALVTVETAEADAGIVYRTDALSSTRVQVTYEVAVDDAPTISYPADVVANPANAPAARRLLSLPRGLQPGWQLLLWRILFEAPSSVHLEWRIHLEARI